MRSLMVRTHQIIFMSSNRDEMDGARSTFGELERCIQGFDGEPEGKKPLGRLRLRWKNNIKTDLQEVDWIDLAQNRGLWRALVNAVMNLRVP
jgi:hypothetical protein